MNAKPATPLPWSRKDGHFHHVRTKDIDYFIHAANAYPRLVAALRDLVANCTPIQSATGRIYGVRTPDRDGVDRSRNLLRELGEIE